MNGQWQKHKQKTKHQLPNVYSTQLTDEFYRFLEMGTDVSGVVVLHRDPLVAVVALGRLQVPARNIEQGGDVKVAEIVLSGGVVGTTEVEERQDLHGRTLKEGRKGCVN